MKISALLVLMVLFFSSCAFSATEENIDNQDNDEILQNVDEKDSNNDEEDDEINTHESDDVDSQEDKEESDDSEKEENDNNEGKENDSPAEVSIESQENKKFEDSIATDLWTIASQSNELESEIKNDADFDPDVAEEINSILDALKIDNEL